MPELSFQLCGVEPAPYAATPTLAFRLRIDSTPATEPIHSVLLRCQIQLEAARRPYRPAEQQRLFDIFGPVTDWGRTLRSIHWADVHVGVAGFTGSTVVDLPVPCSADFTAAAVKYFHALEDGELPLCLLLSGTVFYASGGKALQVAHIPWDNELSFQLPVHVWKRLMDRYYGNSVLVQLPAEVVRRLDQHRRDGAGLSYGQALESLLDGAEAQRRGAGSVEAVEEAGGGS